MKKLLLGAAALLALTLPQAAFSKNIDAGSAGNQPASSQAQPQKATPNFHANGAGTAASCGTGCSAVSGAYHSNQFSGSFSGTLTQTTTFANAGCHGVQGTLNLYSGSDSALLGVTGTLCGASFTGDYTVTDGTGAYQENGAGWGTLHFTSTPSGAFAMNADGTFYGQQARQTGVDYGSPQ
jgi:hypothetical protein